MYISFKFRILTSNCLIYNLISKELFAQKYILLFISPYPLSGGVCESAKFFDESCLFIDELVNCQIKPNSKWSIL